MFNIEAVDLGRVVEVVVGHDGEGYGKMTRKVTYIYIITKILFDNRASLRQ